MTSSLNGLNKFNEHAKSEAGFSTKELAFQRFQWVLDGKLARSSQPYYRAPDRVHTVKAKDVYFLRLKKITCVISVNWCDMDQAGRNRLETAGIAFHRFPVPDMHAPTARQLWDAAELIEQQSASLVYCGYGQGRTGTFVAGWAKLKHKPMIKGLNSATFLDDNFGVERPCQVKALNALTPGAPPPAETPAPTYPPGLGFSGPGLAGNGTFANFGSGPITLTPPPAPPVNPKLVANFNSGASKISW